MTEQPSENPSKGKSNATPSEPSGSGNIPAPKETSTPKRKSTNLKGAPKSKRHDTAKLPADWRKDLWDLQIETLKTQKGQNYKDSENFTRGLAISWLTGLRPSELKTAMCVFLETGKFVIRVSGAKVAKAENGEQLRGIDRRDLIIDPNHPAAAFLINQFHQGNKKWLSKGKTPADTFRKSVNRLGVKYLASKRSKKYTGLSISPYCYRHAMGSDLKTFFSDEVRIAQIMGHLSTDSVAKYGRKRRSSKDVPPILGVQTSQTPHTPERSVRNLSKRNKSFPSQK